MIYCIGDSHTGLFKTTGFTIHHLGPVTAFNMHKRQQNIDDILSKAQNYRTIFVIGEIDCRVHVVKQSRLQNRSIEEVAFEVAEVAFKFIFSNTKHNPIAWGPCYSHSRTKELLNPAAPFYPIGSAAQRNLATDCYNNKLKQLSESAGIPFLTVCGDPHLVYSDDIHLGPKSLPVVINRLNKLLGK